MTETTTRPCPECSADGNTFLAHSRSRLIDEELVPYRERAVREAVEAARGRLYSG